MATMMTTREQLFALHEAMYAADAAFSAAVVAQHGARNAGDMRYLSLRDNDATRSARNAYHAAAEAWRTAFRAASR